MCATLALTLIVATCEPIAIDDVKLNLPVSPVPVEQKSLRDPELDRIRGGFGYIAKVGRDGVLRFVRDGTFREMSLPSAPGTQIVDNWWSEIGSAYIGLSLSQR